MTKTLSLRITGHVQGVSYRIWAVGEARALGLSGWVRNRSDGSVEALVSGPARQVEAFVARCRVGPRAARVAEVVARESAGPVPEGFTQRPTL